MTEFSKNNIYYSIFCPQCDYINSDLLSEIRYNFFVYNKRQKNKITKEIDGEIYHYSYVLEKDKPLRWKKMLKDKLLEKVKEEKDGSYQLQVQGTDKKLTKVIFFDSKHNWVKSEYYRKYGKITFERLPDSKNIKVTEKMLSGSCMSYEIYPVECSKLKSGDESVAMLICKTSAGNFCYYTKSQVVLLKERAEKDKEDNALPTVEPENQNSCNDKQSVESDIERFICYKEKNACPFSKAYGKTIKTDSGEILFYFGHLQDKMRSGFGRTVTSSGVTAYEGDYKNDKKDGFGVYRYSSGELCYVGNFKEDQRSGFGVQFSKNGEKILLSSFEKDKLGKTSTIFDKNGNLLFAGKIVDGQRVGPALECRSNGEGFMVKNFKAGSFMGKCTLFDEDGNLAYSGELSETDSKKCGSGVEYNRDGTVKYKGNWKNDLYDGQGILYLDDGRRIEGQFKCGKVNGFACEFDSKNRKIYEGNWKDNLYNKEGTKYLNNGNYLKGLFEAGLATGVLLEFNSDGEVIYKGNFDEDAYCGEGILYINGEKVYEGNFENNLYNGKGKLFEHGKCVYAGSFKDGLKDGFGKQLRDDELEYIGHWKYDKYNGIGLTYEKAKPRFVGFFENGNKQGRINEVYDGKVVKECLFDKDELVYLKEYKYPDLNIIYDGNIRAGKRNGMGCKFTEYGEKEFEGIFANGNELNSMRVFLKKLQPLPGCDDMADTEYINYRFGPNYVIEKEILGGLYSGLLENGKPVGKGTVLYADHRYTGDFLNGIPKGNGVIYKNNGEKLKGKFFESEVFGSSKIDFESGVSYNFMSSYS